MLGSGPSAAEREARLETNPVVDFSAILGEFLASPEARSSGWDPHPRVDTANSWIHVSGDRSRLPEQGWKLHVSAAVVSAEDVLRRALPVLAAEGAHFKVAGSIAKLHQLNSGEELSQVGKFITVYPTDDAQAVRLAVALDQAMRGLRGPAVPSDRPLGPGSLVHYRYGGFRMRYLQTSLGVILPAISDPNGELVPDLRLAEYQQPDWVTDPFLAAGVATELPSPARVVGGRYLISGTLDRSARGAVYLAIDLVDPRRCILKRAWRDSQVRPDGLDSRARLAHEAEVLARLAPDPRFPATYGVIEQDDEVYLAMEDVEGETLAVHVLRLLRLGSFVPPEQVVAWGRELASALGTIHARGFVYRDLKSANVIVAPEGHLRLLDFDIAHELGSSGPLYGLGSRGYMSPQQKNSHPPAITDDVYSLGAVLFFLLTAAEPSRAPDELSLLNRPLALLNPSVAPGLSTVIQRCLEPDPERRFQSMAEAEAALASVVGQASVPAPPFGGEPTTESEEEARQRALELADRLGDTLCELAQPNPHGEGVIWLTNVDGGGRIASRNLNNGGCGALLALAELVAVLGRAEHRAVLAEAAKALLVPSPGFGRPLPGLYVGEAGVGAVLLRTGQVLQDPALIAAALERGRWVAEQPHESPDLFNGTAGRLRFHLLLWDETGQPEQLAAAVAAGERLLEGAEPVGPGELQWRMVLDFDDEPDQVYLGYAHGAAGVGDALLDLYEATADERFLEGARAAGRWLARQAVPALDDQSGLTWPMVEGREPTMAFWCHGAAGIGRFFLHAAQLGVLPEAGELAAGAARTVARGTRSADPTQCHGLAGGIEYLLDMAQATGDRAYLFEARSLGRLFEAFASERHGMLVWPSEMPVSFGPQYMDGYAGSAVCLLRLGHPEMLPHQMSRAGFRYRANATRESVV